MYQSYNDAREERIRIFENTAQLCREHPLLKKSIEASRKGQVLILEGKPLQTNTQRQGAPAHIIVSKRRSLEAAVSYRDKKVVVHNFASATNPGGGVTKGSSAQEEAICRCSTLYFAISTPQMRQGFYDKHRTALRNGSMTALYNGDCIYTPGVTVFKSDTDHPTLLDEKEWMDVDVITCAAPNLRERPSNSMNPGSGQKAVRIDRNALKELHKKRMGRIMEIAASNEAEVLILGAFGCGAFQNPPEVVASAFVEVLEKYRNCFETIEFAVYCTPRDTRNYDTFKRILGGDTK